MIYALVGQGERVLEGRHAAGVCQRRRKHIRSDLRLRYSAAQAKQIGPAVLEAVSAFRGGKPADDDQTLIVQYHAGTNPPDGPVARLKAIARLVGIIH